MKQLLCGKEIIKSYGEGERNVLDGVSLEMEEGEFVAVMGPSGSGKSTLLYALSGMDTINDGKVLFEDRELSEMQDDALSDLRRSRMGFVFQQPTLLKNLNILDNIILPMARDNRGRLQSLVQRAKELMRQVGIEELADRDINRVSGGQLQRAGICRALMNRPGIIFGDEPTGALNSKASGEVMDLFTQINESGTAVLLVTHDAGVAARTGRVLFMRDGKIVSELRLPPYESGDAATRIEKITREMRCIGI